MCWPQSLSELLSKELKKQLQKMQGEQAVKISYDDGAGYLQHCQHFWRAKKVSIYIHLGTMNYYQEKICGKRVNLSSYIAIFGIKIWENL